MNSLIMVSGDVRDHCLVDGIAILRRGGALIDAAELVARAVEDDMDDHTVGFSGLPNILGEVELDASIMDGATLSTGAVAAIQGFAHPVSVARQVMERLPHVLLVGAGAARFGDEVGAERREMLTPEAKAIWLNRLTKLGISLADLGLSDDGAVNRQSPQVVNPQGDRGPKLIDYVNRAHKYHEGGDTMNVIARAEENGHGHIVSAVTTSGVAWKYPGRVGDSPIIGAGQYADDRFGAAACTGVGELAIRQGTALRAVMMLRAGMTLEQAGRATMQDLLPLSKPINAWLRLILMDAAGKVAGFCTHKGATLKVQSVADNAPRVVECEFVQ